MLRCTSAQVLGNATEPAESGRKEDEEGDQNWSGSEMGTTLKRNSRSEIKCVFYKTRIGVSYDSGKNSTDIEM